MSRGTTKLFIGNLPDVCHKEELQAKFEKYGVVTELDIISNYGFVHFQNEDEAQAAADALNGTNYMGKNIRVEMSTSKVRQKAGMGESDGCYRCGKPGHWSKSCPRGPRRPRPQPGAYGRDPFDDPYYDDPYPDPYLRDRYPPPPPPPYRYDPYFDPYDRRPLPPLPRDPYRERFADPYARPMPDYYRRSPPPPETAGRAPPPPNAARYPLYLNDDPYAKESLMSRPTAADPYSAPKPGASANSYASAASADPYAGSRPADPYGTRPDPYANSGRAGDPYATDVYSNSAARTSDPYATQMSAASSNSYGNNPYGVSSRTAQAPYTGNTKDPYENYYDRKKMYETRPSPYSKPMGDQSASSMGYQAPSQARVPGPY